MRLSILVLLQSLSFLNCQAQVNDKIDSLVNELCISFNEEEAPLDSIIVRSVFSQHLDKYFAAMSDSAANNAGNKIFLRLQVKCSIFEQYMQATAKHTGWQKVYDCPRSTLADAELKKFFTMHSFWYAEPSGGKTKLNLSNGFWTEHMADGTYSKLSFEKLAPDEFAITFIESTNKIKKNLSRAGDVYYYSLIAKGKNYYTLCVTVPGLDGGSTFNVYYK